MRILPLLLLGCGGSGIRPASTDTPPPTDTDTDADSDTDTDTDADADSDADADTDSDTDTDSDADTDTGAPLPWSHTATVDGSAAEYGPDETFATSGGTTWITWDATDLYLAVQHPDVAAGGPQHWLLVYLSDGSGSGSLDGVAHNTQQPTLPAPMTTLVRWKADGSYDSLETWSGTAWTSTPSWLGTAGSEVAEDPAASIVELRIPLAAVGAVDTLDLHVAWVYEGTGYESTYSGTPASSFTDGYDPDFTRWYAFDLTASTAPSDTLPLP